MRYLKDLLVTDRFLIRGHIGTGGQRLTTFLNNTPRRYVEMNEATIVEHCRRDPSYFARTFVRLQEILLAYEMEETGDEILKTLAERDRYEVPVTAHFGGCLSLQIQGTMSRRVLDRDASGGLDFIIVLKPEIRGLANRTEGEYEVLDNLPYIIANRERMALLCH